MGKTIKVFGFTEDKHIVPVHLPVDVVVSHRIHPWWVDLFADDPVKIEVRGQALSFTRLTGICFAIPSSCETVFKGGILHSGEWLSFRIPASENQFSRYGGPFELTGDSFESLFKRLLTVKEVSTAITDIPCIYFLRGSVRFPTNRNLTHGIPFPEGTEEEHQINGYAFTGKTIEKVRIHQPFTPELEWVFQAFASWNPVVFGGCLRDFVQGNQMNDIDFFVDSHSSVEVQQYLEQLDEVANVENMTAKSWYRDDTWETETPVFRFMRNGRQYDLVCRGKPLADHFWWLTDFSVNQLYAERPGEVTASRICLWDIAHRQARIVSRATSLSTLRFRWKDRAQTLEAKGYTVLNNPFGYDSYTYLGRKAEEEAK